MKILYLLNQNSFPSPTMSQTFILNQITGMIDLGHDVSVVASCPPEPGSRMHPDVISYDLMKRIRYFEPPAESRIKKLIRVAGVGLRLLVLHPVVFFKAIGNYGFCQREFTLNILYLIDSLWDFSGHEVVNCHFGVNGRLAVILRDLGVLNGRIVTTFHGMDTRFNGAQERELYRELFSKGDCFVAISAFNQQYLLGIGANPKKIVKQPMGVDVNRFAFRDKPFDSREGKINILTVARLSEEKGLEYSIEAMGQLKSRYVAMGLHYKIIGDGDGRDDLMVLIDRLGLKDVVSMPGAMDQPGIVQEMTRADIFILPSTREALPVVIMEAMAIGLPVVATDVGGIKELVIDGKTGFLVAARDTQAMVQKLEYLIGDPEARLQMGREGRRVVDEHYNLQRLNVGLTEIYQGLIHEG